MSLLCLFTRKIISRTIARKSNLFSTSHCKFISSKIQSKHSKLDVKLSSQMDIDAKLVDSAKEELLHMYDAGITAVLPATLIRKKVRLADDNFTENLIDGESYMITDEVYIAGFGKAVAGMAFAMEEILGPRLIRGIISVPRLSKCSKVETPELQLLREGADEQCQNLQTLKRSTVIEYCEAADDNQPDDDSLKNTEKIVELAQGLVESDTLIVLISGGGSALLFQPKAPITADAKRDLCKKLQDAGASITELNCVRKQLSTIKGGGLAKIAYPAKVLTLILSDIVGDRLDFIASGPTCTVSSCEGEDPRVEAINILERYGLYDKHLDENVRFVLTEPEEELTPEQKLEQRAMIDEDGKFKHVDNIIIGNNVTALEAAALAGKNLGLECIILSNLVEGDVKDVSYAYARLTRLMCHVLEKSFSTKEDFIEEFDKTNLGDLKIKNEKLEETYEILVNARADRGIVLLAGGEPTVVVEGSGKGGRNQELALRYSLDWLSEIARDPVLAKYFALFLSIGTDGQDGPTDAAGAFGHPGFRPKLTVLQKELLKRKKVTAKPDELEDIENKLDEIEKLLPENCIESTLEDNDSYHFYSNFEGGKYLVKTDLTGTNVMDLHFIYLKKRSCRCDILELYPKKEEASKPKKKFGDCPEKIVMI